MKTYEDEIAPLREEINKINIEIMEKLTKRVEIALEISNVKQRYGKSIVDKNREARVYQQVRDYAIQKGLDSEGVEKIFTEIIALCIQAEMEENR
jgi:chorismate mutase/prephenate dehydratase